MKTYLTSLLVATCMVSCSAAFAEETVAEKANTVANKTVDATKEGARDLSDKACEMIDGKMKCLPKKIKHKAQTMKDKTKTKATEIKDKVDNH